MLSNDLNKLLAPFAQITNRHALSVNYRTLEVQPRMLRACAAYGILEADAALGISDPFFVDTGAFCAVVKSLPADEEVIFKVMNNALHWECGLASGKLALVGADIIIPQMPKLELEGISVPAGLADGLGLGSLSCGDSSLATAGIYGMVLDNRTCLCAYASDDITISYCVLAAEAIGGFPDRITLAPDAVRLLITVLDDKAMLVAGETAINVKAGAYQLLIKSIPAHKRDIAALQEQFAQAKVKVALPRERIAAFIKRATALAESARHAYVDLMVTQGAIALAFTEDKAASEEYYLADDLDAPDLPPIRIEAARMARALAHTDYIVLDHIERSVLILAGDKPPFTYLLSGRKE
jgi:hypothetical protein